MSIIVSITSQGQLTIPKAFREEFNIMDGAKAVIKKQGDTLLVTPKLDFWDLGGALASPIKLTKTQVKKARKEFEKSWANNE